MKAWVIEEFGGRDRLRLAERPDPEAGEGEVVVRIHAAGVNPVDWKIREGYLKDLFPHEFPLIPGWDAAGVVEETGHSARRFRPGDEVYTYARRPVIAEGTYAERIALPESYLARKPDPLSMAEAASLPLAALTAYQALFDAADLKSGENLFVMGASGGVGSCAVQFGRIEGARVVGMAGGGRSDYLREMGAVEAIDYTKGPFSEALRSTFPDGADVVFDLVGGETLRQGFGCVKEGGRLVSIVDPPDEEEARRRNVSAGFVFVEPHAPQLDRIREMVASGRFGAHVSRVYDFDRVPEAHEQMETGHTVGKIVLQW